MTSFPLVYICDTFYQCFRRANIVIVHRVKECYMRQFVCVIVTLIGVGSLLLGGCSGGGGSDQLPTRSNTSLAVPSECIAYCTFVCSKVGICNNLSQDDVNTCANTCVNTIEQQGLA